MKAAPFLFVLFTVNIGIGETYTLDPIDIQWPTLQPGDTVLFQSGQTYRTRIDLVSGVSYRSTGIEPASIDGGVLLTDWELFSPNLWRSLLPSGTYLGHEGLHKGDEVLQITQAPRQEGPYYQDQFLNFYTYKLR